MKTKWFNAKKKPPVHVGWYEVKCLHGIWGGGHRLWWDGKKWICGEDRTPVSFGFYCDSWRGQTEPA